jgi:hypothetical protein
MTAANQMHLYAARAYERHAARIERIGPEVGWWTTKPLTAQEARLRAFACWAALGLGF